MAAQILYSRALARTWAQNEKKEGSLVESVVRYLHSFLTGGGGFRRRELEVVANPKQFRNLEQEKNKIEGKSFSEKTRERRNSTRPEGTNNTYNNGSGSGFDFASVRRAVLDGVLRRVTNSQASQLRRKAFDQLICEGNSAPFLSLLGVSLASGSGIVTKEDEIESICFEIRQAISKTRLVSDDSVEEENVGYSWSLQDFDLGQPIAQGCAAVVYSAKTKMDTTSSDGQYPLAVKMMFNYDVESNASTIMRAMQRETVPAKNVGADIRDLTRDMVHLEHHPNIVNMVTVFADQVPHIPGDISLYGSALPMRINPHGYGRNMSLFLVMKKYDMSLADYLSQYQANFSSRTSSFILTQLMEAVAFLGSQGVAHRDLKTDNILLSLDGGHEYPHLVITDFGCCLADKHNKLTLSYTSPDTYRGGNCALMPPEISSAIPGPFTSISYGKSDLWSAATLAYQIFGGSNPFLSSGGKRGLDSRRYDITQLPQMPEGTPPIVSQLIRSSLSVMPGHRPRPRMVATVLQLLLWCPSSWYNKSHPTGLQVPSNQDILQWLLTMATKVICESRWGNSAHAQFEYQIVATFLVSTSFRDVKEALAWMHSIQE